MKLYKLRMQIESAFKDIKNAMAFDCLNPAQKTSCG
nr:hypothetical protein [Legionella rowbothamii]